MSFGTWRGIAASFALGALVALGGCAAGSDQRSGAIPFTEAAVSSTDGRSFTVAWKSASAGAVNIYAGTDPAHVGHDHKVGAGAGSGEITVTDLPPAPRWYFSLEPDHGAPLVLADRSLHLPSAPNFRDAGGYRTADGHWVRMGLLYRSDQLDRLTPDDLKLVHGVGIKLVCDLRTETERKQGLDRLPEGAQSLIADVAGPGSASSGLAAMISSPDKARALLADGKGAALMIAANRDFVSKDSARIAYQAVFERLSDPAMLPGVFHCTAGKDRTGWAQAVFLSIMGVPRETIRSDYLASNAYLAEKNRRLLAMIGASASRTGKNGGALDPAWIQPLLDVRPEYLDAAFDEVEKRYGSMDSYLHEGLGLSDATLQSLRRLFLAG